MRYTWTLVPLAIGGFAGTAVAETWEVRPSLVTERSAAMCDKSPTNVTLELIGLTLTGSTAVNPKMFSATTATDGAVKQEFKLLNGTRVSIEGNAKTRDLEFINSRDACRWKLVPVK